MLYSADLLHMARQLFKYCGEGQGKAQQNLDFTFVNAACFGHSLKAEWTHIMKTDKNQYCFLPYHLSYYFIKIRLPRAIPIACKLQDEQKALFLPFLSISK